MNSSLLAKMNSGFEKVENHEENAASRSRKVIEEVKVCFKLELKEG